MEDESSSDKQAKAATKRGSTHPRDRIKISKMMSSFCAAGTLIGER